MPPSRKNNSALSEENHRLRAQVAQLQDRLDHLEEHGSSTKSVQQIEALHREVMSVVSDVVLIADEAGRLKYVSANAHLIFGHPAAELLKHGRIQAILPTNLYDPDILEQRGEISNIACDIRDAVGRARNLLVTVRRLTNGSDSVLYVCRDATERVKLQQQYELVSYSRERSIEERTKELRESRERYRRLVEGLRDEYLFYATAPDGTITYVSPAIFSILGYTPDQVLGRNWREFVDGPALEELEELERMRFTGILTPLYIARIIHANGSIRILEFRDAPVQDPDGRVIANEGIGKDVTKRHEDEEKLKRAHDELEQHVKERTAELTAANEQLRDSEHRYRSVVEDQLEYIVRWKGDGIRTFVNDAYCRARLCGRDELIGKSFLPALVEEDRERLRGQLQSLSIDNPVLTHEQRVVKVDGSVAWEQWSNRALFSPEGKLIEFQSVGMDVTERHKREELAAEREKSLAKFASLSERERDVMEHVVSGDANKVIARKLGLSIKTVEKHRSSLMKKLHVRSVPELVRLAMLLESSARLS